MNDPLGLNIDLAGVSTAMPVLPAAKYPMHIASVEPKQGKDDPNKRNLLVSFTTAEDVTLADGSIISAGFKLSKYYPLQQSDNPKAPDFRRDLAVLVDAALGTDESNRPSLGEAAASLAGRTVIASLAIENDPVYGSQNRIGRLSSPA